MSQKSRDNKGCFSPKGIVVHRLDDLEFKVCPGNSVSYWALFMCELYAKFQKGILPCEGSFTDQPNKLIEAFNVIEDWSNKKIEEQEKKRNLTGGLRKNRIRNSR